MEDLLKRKKYTVSPPCEEVRKQATGSPVLPNSNDGCN